MAEVRVRLPLGALYSEILWIRRLAFEASFEGSIPSLWTLAVYLDGFSKGR